MSDIPTLSGPSFGPASGGAARQLVLMLHGFGANGDDLIGLAQPLSEVLPDAAFIAPNAPFPCQANPFGGYQWFDLWQGESEGRLPQLRHAAEMVDAFIESELERLGLEAHQLAFLGFSQGTMLSLHTGLRRAVAPAGILGYSGRLEAAEYLADEITVRPPVLLIHGEEDPMLSIDQMEKAESRLSECGVSVETHSSPGLGHGIDADGIRLGGDFLRRVFDVG
jgi:phospholipase/carboxylesterase